MFIVSKEQQFEELAHYSVCADIMFRGLLLNFPPPCRTKVVFSLKLDCVQMGFVCFQRALLIVHVVQSCVLK